MADERYGTLYSSGTLNLRSGRVTKRGKIPTEGICIANDAEDNVCYVRRI